jgi:hypothetical protein
MINGYCLLFSASSQDVKVSDHLPREPVVIREYIFDCPMENFNLDGLWNGAVDTCLKAF